MEYSYIILYIQNVDRPGQKWYYTILDLARAGGGFSYFAEGRGHFTMKTEKSILIFKRYFFDATVSPMISTI